MSEFIREVDEDYRQDQIRRLLVRYQVPLAAVVVVVLVAVGGWRFLDYRRHQKAEEAGARYFAATELEASDRAASLSALDGLAREGAGGYALLAKFRAAAETGQGDPAAGIKAFDALAADSSLEPDWRDVARLRAAILVANTGSAADAKGRLDPLTDANAPFRNVAREVLATSMLDTDPDGAKRLLDAIVADAGASPTQRQRAALYLSLIRAGKPSAPPP